MLRVPSSAGNASHSIEGREYQRVQGLAQLIANEVRRRFGDDIEVIWFGSWARGSAQPHSDIDIAIASTRPIEHRDFAALRAWIDHLPTLYSVDLVNLQETGETLQRQARETGMRI